MDRIDAHTRLCILIGDPVEHSFSPLIHNAAFAARKLNFAYLACQVAKDHLAPAISGLRALGIRGASVTIPHKVTARRFVDWIEPAAQQIGSINTIVNDQGVLKGFNTDGAGALKAFRDRGSELSGKTALILGSGGAARAVAVTLTMKANIRDLTITGIVEEEVSALVEDLQKITPVPVNAARLDEAFFREKTLPPDVLINCTPVGMYPKMEQSPAPTRFLKPGMTVFDAVYNPPKTTLLAEAEKAGCTIISGLEMFINQAVLQFELWTKERAPEEVMKKVILDNILRKT